MPGGTPVIDSSRADFTAPAIGAAAVTPNDSTDLSRTPTRALYIGGAGNLVVDMAEGPTVTFTAVPVGIFPISVKRVRSTSTTATNIIALY
jgi:hypothetical protein